MLQFAAARGTWMYPRPDAILSADPPSMETGYDFSDVAYLALLKDCRVFEVCGGVVFAHVSEVCAHFLDQQA